MLNIVRNGLVGLALLATLGGVAMADTSANQCTAPGMHHRQGSFMQKLNLTADQQSQVQGFRQQYRQEQRADRQAFDEQLKLVLNQDQMAQWQAHQQAMQERREAGQTNPQSRPRRHHSNLAYLHLSAEQKAQLQAYREAQMPQRRGEREQLMGQIRGILTANQQVTFDQLQAHRHWGARFPSQG